MRKRRVGSLLVLTALAMASTASIAFAPNAASDCRTWPTSTSDLLVVLGKRAVEAASLATRAEREDPRLSALVSRDADFRLGAGDVGREMGQGIPGLRKLLNEVRADRYRFDGWNYMSKKEDPCAAHDVTVEFSSLKEGGRAEVKFKFVKGRIVEATGWYGSMTSGSFPVSAEGR